ncbi:SKI family transcriptional corepressor 1, partial [Python bivittatus]|uniref:SKI family transcriptional corepressor 1 n=1 Tax=Python bivittatus TaxID=176946 RepID=A0A9F3QTW0_PYTBI
VRPPAAEMEPLAAASQLGAGRDSGSSSSSSSSASSSSSSSPHSKQELQPYAGSSPLKPNQVGETSLYGVPIVSLVIDGQERLCLAQISNTLLKNYSYNEIHNRRVALGITCVQCTPVQLEILRRAGAMPISSRRCGMITKREAERLCKSFLGEHKPPTLPENFAFDVVHECAWGSRGSFIPARYNSSRAKCIKCSYCSMYFSPNKFIFHSHRTPDAKYTQPDAANFNSWRRHLKLSDKAAAEDLSHAWEDVKAMFNGGTHSRPWSDFPGSVREGRESWDAKAYPSGREDCPQALKAGASLGPPITPYLCAPEKNDPDHEDNHSAAEDLESKKPSPNQRSVSQHSPTHAERDELQRLLLEQMDLRKKLEREFQSLKGTFRVLSRGAAPLPARPQPVLSSADTLCNELDQERKARYAIQQKLKEAHDALHHFSCKMLTPRHCAGNCSFKPPLLPQ